MVNQANAHVYHQGNLERSDLEGSTTHVARNRVRNFRLLPGRLFWNEPSETESMVLDTGSIVEIQTPQTHPSSGLDEHELLLCTSNASPHATYRLKSADLNSPAEDIAS